MMDGMNNQANTMLANQEEIAQAGQAITEQFGSLADALENLISWHNRVKDGLGQQIAAFQQTIASQTAIQQRMEEERQHALNIVRQLATTQANLGPAATAIGDAGASVKQASDSLFSTEKALRDMLVSVTDATNELNDRQIQTLDRYQAIHALLQQMQP
jgi:chromosome segregation ATPase